MPVIDLPDFYLHHTQFPMGDYEILAAIEKLEELRLQKTALDLVGYLDQGIARMELSFDDYEGSPNLTVYYEACPDVPFYGDDFPDELAGVMTAEGIGETLDLALLQDTIQSIGTDGDGVFLIAPHTAEMLLQHVYGHDYPRFKAESRALALESRAPAAQPGISRPRM
jgi:hypothetical protein